ncbi:MAG TPA: dual specificity protein phosphatase family protein [Streptosporangiaceae bacterium]
MRPEGTVIGVSRLDDYVLLAHAGLAMAMVSAGAQRLIDLRGETTPPGLPVPLDHFPIMDLEPGQDDLILAAGRHVLSLACAGTVVGLYCQAGLSRTSTVAIAYLMLGGASLRAACDQVRAVRPQAMPALELWHSLEAIEIKLSIAGRAAEVS